MKKIFLISLIATAILTSCSDEVLNTLDGNTIRFDNALIESRATDLTTENLKAFYVHGWMTNSKNQTANIFDKVEVYNNGTSWAYDGGGRYWFGDTKYQFLAFAPLNADYTLADNRESLTFTNDAHMDFVYASYNRTIEGSVPTSVDPVALSFDHMLSRVLVRFYNEFTIADVTLDVANLKLKGLAKTADLDLVNKAWATPTDNSLELDLGFPNATINRNETDSSIVAGKSANTEHFYIIPEDIKAEEYRLDFDVTVWQGPAGEQIKIGKYHHSVALDKMLFEMGKQYRLAAKLNSSNVNPDAELQPITFTVTVMPWGEDIHSDLDFNN